MSRAQLIGAANVLMLILFTSWAAFQYNDPDAALWIPIYGLAAVSISLFHFRRISPKVLWTYSGITFLVGAYMAVLFLRQPALLMEDMLMFVEEGREMLGAWIVSGWMAFLATQLSRRSRSPRAKTSSQ